MVLVMQWVPAIHNHMRKVRLKYQHIPPTLCPALTLYQEKKPKCEVDGCIYRIVHVMFIVCMRILLLIFVFKLVSNEKMSFTC